MPKNEFNTVMYVVASVSMKDLFPPLIKDFVFPLKMNSILDMSNVELNLLFFFCVVLEVKLVARSLFPQKQGIHDYERLLFV